MQFLRRRKSCKVWKFWFEIFYFKVLFINFLDYVYNSTFFSHHICQIIPKLFHRRIEFRIEPKYMLRVLSNYDILQIWITYYIHEYIYTTNFVYKKKCSLFILPWIIMKKNNSRKTILIHLVFNKIQNKMFLFLLFLIWILNFFYSTSEWEERSYSKQDQSHRKNGQSIFCP